MSDDLVKRLRDMNGGWASDEALAAADRIEELEAENKRLKALVADVIHSTGDDPEIMAASRAEWAARALEADVKLAKALAEMEKVDDYLTILQTPNSEPLNSVNACENNIDRAKYTAAVRNEAREYWASLGNTIAELTGGKDE